MRAGIKTDKRGYVIERDPMWDLVDDPKVIVEIGSHRGYTAYRALVNTDADVYCVDPWEDYKAPDCPGGYEDMDLTFQQWNETMQPYLDKRVWALRGTSLVISREFDLPIDLLYIDGDHSVNGCLLDLRKWTPKVRPGGVVVGDNYELSNVQKAVARFRRNVNVGWWLYKKWKFPACKQFMFRIPR